MKELLDRLLSVLKGVRVPMSNEKLTQKIISEIIVPIGFIREYRLDNKNIPDFFSEGIAVEIKIKGSKKSIYRQIERYCKFEQVKIIVLITGRSMGLPEEIYNKPVYYINLSKAFL